MSNSLGGDVFTLILQENTFFNLDLGVKVTRNIAQYLLHHVTYTPAKFEVDRSNSLGEDTITRNLTDRQTDVRADRQIDIPTLVRN